MPNQYIVTLRSGAKPEEVIRAHNVEGKHQFRAAFRGFTAELSAGQLRSLQRNGDVVAIEENQRVELAAGGQNPTPNWGLDRINHRDLPLDNRYSWDSAGSSVTAYVIDTGIITGHFEFGGRATNVFDAFGGNGEDCHGHGTHVAGIIGGKNTGVAKNVSLRGLRAVDCTGWATSADIIAALDWVRGNAAKPAVVNMSLGTGPSAAINLATNNVIASGVPVVAAAMNTNEDACNWSPQAVAKAVVVGATNRYDIRETYSNFGPCVDIHAPGHLVFSADKDADGYGTRSGTSMAAPHVAGAIARYLQLHPDWSADDVAFQILFSASQPDIGNIPPATTKRLLYMGPDSPPVNTDVEYGYLWSSHPNTPIGMPVTPTSGYQRNSTGGLNIITRIATGKYEVDFAGLSVAGGIAHATSMDSDGYCKIQTWFSVIPKQRVVVQCRDLFGAPKDTRFRVTYMRALKAIAGSFGYLFAGNKSAPSYTPDSLWSYNSKVRTNKVVREAAGRYKLIFPSLAHSPGNVMVTAQGDDANFCNVRLWTKDLQVPEDQAVYVNCYAPNGSPADTNFNATFTDTRSVGGATGTRAHAWVPGLHGKFTPPEPPHTPTSAYNSEVFPLSVSHLLVGYYSVKIPGVLGSFEGDIQVAAQGESPHHCSASPTIGTSARDVTVMILCKSTSGQKVDSAFNLHYAQ
ncbi:S8 family peptidase [Kribbella sp. CA-253562]|uniref:S8 family peptidase n=1 Tax=Kribbella sp. CA-253562 TaxID=3239942 RepID=UPI003D8F0838